MPSKTASDVDIHRNPGSGPHEFGLRLRDLRLKRQLTIQDVARTANVSAGILSQVERGKSQPSLDILFKVCDALDVTLHDIIPGDKNSAGNSKIFVQRSEKRTQRTLGTLGISKEYLTPYRDYGLRLLEIKFPPRSASDQMLIGPGEKAGYILVGELNLTVGDTFMQLKAGDGFQFPSNVYHKFENPSDQVTEVIWVMNMTEGSF